MPLQKILAEMPVAEESPAGYERTKFKHWVDAHHDGCSTRAETPGALTDRATTRHRTTPPECERLQADEGDSRHVTPQLQEPHGTSRR
jgi:hypothetical protein